MHCKTMENMVDALGFELSGLIATDATLIRCVNQTTNQCLVDRTSNKRGTLLLDTIH
jgi:hypothetical protein